ncbi:hypothetical protein J1614_003971 [Plenodomus biglobosus]|nr:hypothetical protein J1614_003971 [Plenodomus biglobosus]
MTCSGHVAAASSHVSVRYAAVHGWKYIRAETLATGVIQEPAARSKIPPGYCVSSGSSELETSVSVLDQQDRN